MLSNDVASSSSFREIICTAERGKCNLSSLSYHHSERQYSIHIRNPLTVTTPKKGFVQSYVPKVQYRTMGTWILEHLLSPDTVSL